MRLQNKICLITGAARGIGLATAQLFVQEGAHVILTDIQDEAGQAEALSLGSLACYRHLDVSSESEWKDLAQWIFVTYGRLDVLVNNAGIIGIGETFGPQDPENTSLESWHQVHAINLDGTFLGCKYAIDLMRKSKSASIVNMSSRSGLVGIPTAVAYASSKAAVRNHTKSVALYCAGLGLSIRCNSLHPGAILTPLWDPMLGENPQAVIDVIAQGIPLGHMGDPLDVAYAALYLASDESKY